jgi:very-short-patch-repair endonuclease
MKRQEKLACADEMRANPTRAEARFIEFLQEGGWWHLFEFQVVRAGYILDFYSDPLHLCIEIDGLTHEFSRKHDRIRDKVMRHCHIRTVRIKNEQIYKRKWAVMARLHKLLGGNSLTDETLALSDEFHQIVAQ